MEKTQTDFSASIKVLRHNLNGYHSGTKECYRPVSVELRKLLCDKNPLLSRAKPEIRLHKLNWTEIFEKSPSLKEGLTMIMPGRLTVKNGTGFFELMFADSKTLMEISDWIEQPFLNIQITIREIIKSVGDKEGAHSDLSYNDTLLLAKKIKYLDNESHISGIIGIGDYLSSLLNYKGNK